MGSILGVSVVHAALTVLWAVQPLVSSPSLDQFAEVPFSNHEEVVFEGDLTFPAAATLITQLRAPTVKRLIISSAGGDELAALDVSDVVRERELDVTVRQRCASACANSILVAANSVTLENGAVVAFHHSSPTIERNYVELGLPVPNRIAEGASRIRRLYLDRSVRIELLECAAAKIGLTRQRVEVPVPGSDRRLSGFRARYRFWIPPDQTLADNGLSVFRVGRQPATADAQQQLGAGSLLVMGGSRDCEPADTREP